MRDEIRTSVEAHDRERGAHRAALEAYPSKDALRSEIEKLGLILTNFQERSLELFALVQKDIGEMRASLGVRMDGNSGQPDHLPIARKP